MSNEPIYSALNGKSCTDSSDCEHLCVYSGGGFYGYICAGSGTGEYPYCCPPTMNGRDFYTIYSSGTCENGVCGDTPENVFEPA